MKEPKVMTTKTTVLLGEYCSEAAACSCSSKYVLIEILQYSQQNTCVRVFIFTEHLKWVLLISSSSQFNKAIKELSRITQKLSKNYIVSHFSKLLKTLIKLQNCNIKYKIKFIKS